MLSPRNVPSPKGNSHQHSPWDGLALSVHWKTLRFSSAVMLRTQSWPLWKWEKELTLSLSQGQNLALRISRTVHGAHEVPSLSCSKLKKSCFSHVKPQKMARFQFCSSPRIISNWRENFHIVQAGWRPVLPLDSYISRAVCLTLSYFSPFAKAPAPLSCFSEKAPPSFVFLPLFLNLPRRPLTLLSSEEMAAGPVCPFHNLEVCPSTEKC